MWLPQNNTFIRQCNLFAYRKYMSTHSTVCCQPPGMILMRNINGRCPENMLVLVSIASRDMVAAILFNFCEDDSITYSAYVLWLLNTAISLDHRDLKSCFANLTSLIQLTNRLEKMCSYLIDVHFSLIQFTYHPKYTFSPVFFFKFPVFSRPGSLSFRIPGFPGIVGTLTQLYHNDTQTYRLCTMMTMSNVECLLDKCYNIYINIYISIYQYISRSIHHCFYNAINSPTL